MTAIGCLQTSTESTLCVFPTCVSNHGLRLFLSFKDRWWVVKPIHLGVGVRQALRICFSVVLCVAGSVSVIISTWHKHRISYSSGWSVLLSSYTHARLSYCTDQLPLCSLGKYVAFCIKQSYFEASLEMRTLCACVRLCVNPIIIIYNQ